MCVCVSVQPEAGLADSPAVGELRRPSRCTQGRGREGLSSGINIPGPLIFIAAPLEIWGGGAALRVGNGKLGLLLSALLIFPESRMAQARGPGLGGGAGDCILSWGLLPGLLGGWTPPC